MSTLTRKAFIQGLGSAAALALTGCGGDAGDGDASLGTGARCNETIAANHGHVFDDIPQVDLDAVANKTYTFIGFATTTPHTHTVTLTPTQLQDLKAGRAVAVTSSTGGLDNHTHAVTITCT